MIKKLLSIYVLFITVVCFGQQSTSFSDIVGFSDDGNCNYTNTSGGGWNNNMLTSENFIAPNTDGSVSYIISNTSDKLAFGLSIANSSIKVKDITYRMLLGKKLSIWENKKMKGNYGNLSVGDELTISRVADEMLFIKNGNVILSLNTDPNLTLYVKVSAQTSNLTVSCDDLVGDYYEEMELNFNVLNAACDQSFGGSIVLDVINGIPPYSYQWDNGEITKDLSNLEIGTYSVTVTDNIGFIAQGTININSLVEWRNISNGYACGTEFIKTDSWVKLYGGNTNEYPGEIQKTSDGGFIMSVNSSDGSNIPEHHGGEDAWIVKLDIDGNIEWSRILGGSANENLFYIEEDAFGNFICGGGTFSSDGNISVNKGSMDFWAVKLDNLGNILWSKTYGGSGADKAQDIEVTSDGGYILGGESWSNDGDVTGGSGNNDYWVIKLDSNGNIIWEKTIGGASYEGASSIQEHSNGDIIVVGLTYSSNNDFAGLPKLGGGDLGFVRLSSTGNVEYVNLYGGSHQDGVQSLTIEVDDGIVIASRTASSDFDVPSSKGSNDYWLFKIDNSGTIQWSKTYGGSASDNFMDIRKTTDNGFVLTGYTASEDGDVYNNHGSTDIWIIKTDSVGNLEWSKTYGSKRDEEGTSVVEINEGQYMVLGVATSTGGPATPDPSASFTTQACLKKITNFECDGENIITEVSISPVDYAVGVSTNRIYPEEDGLLNYIVTEIGKEEIIGLVEVPQADFNNNYFSYSYQLSNSVINILEEGSLVHTISNYSIGDQLTIKREGSNINYYHNDALIRTLSVDNQKYLAAKVVLLEEDAITLGADFCNSLTTNYTTYKETPSTLGTIVLNPEMGIPPYTFLWDDGYIYGGRDSLESNFYHITITDSISSQIELDIPLGFDMYWRNVNGIEVQRDVITKDGIAGWGTAVASIDNLNNSDIALRLPVSELNKEWAFGFVDVANEQAVSYSNLAYGFYISEANNLYYVEGSSITQVAQLNFGDVLSLAKTSDQLSFKVNGSTLKRIGYLNDRQYRIDFTFSSSKIAQGPVIIIGNDPFSTNIDVEIEHLNCYLSYGGAIDITVNNAFISDFTYEWTGPNGFESTDEDIDNLEPGIYTVTATALPPFPPNSLFAFQHTESFEVGYSVYWNDMVNTVVDNHDLGKDPNLNQGWDAGAASINLLEENIKGATSFTLEDDFYNGLLGSPNDAVFVYGLSQTNQNEQENSIEYGIEIFKAYACCPGGVNNIPPRFRVIETGGSPTYTSGPNIGSFVGENCSIGDKFTIERDGDDIIYYRNAVPFYTTQAAIPNTIYNKKLLVDASIYEGFYDPNNILDPSFQIYQPYTTFPCISNPKPMYAQPAKKLDGSFYVAQEGQLFLKYKEDYKSGTLAFKIYDETGNTVLNSAQYPNPKQFGTNWYRLNFNTFPGFNFQDYYILEVENDKEQSEFLRFKYWDNEPNN